MAFLTPIIRSLTDIDLYKLTMLQAFTGTSEFKGAVAEWKFTCRNPQGKNLGLLVTELRNQLEHLCSLHFTETELGRLGRLYYLKPGFISFLRMLRLDMRYLSLQVEGNGFDLRARGPLELVMLFEIYVLAIVSELNTQLNWGGLDCNEGRRRLYAKIQQLRAYDYADEVVISDFSTRRRAARDWQYEMVDILRHEIPQNLAGTSNVYLAGELGLTPIGTMAHEWFQAWQAVVPLQQAQKAALEGWIRAYRGDLGIALTDNYCMDAFCRDFDRYHAKLFDGLRHDSGDPIAWGEKAIALFERLRVDPRSKSLIFSDGLTIPKTIAIHRHFRERIKTVFGIGTDLGNDFGREPLNIVMKLIAINGQPVAKISDAPGKSMCEDIDYLRLLAKFYAIDPDLVRVAA